MPQVTVGVNVNQIHVTAPSPDKVIDAASYTGPNGGPHTIPGSNNDYVIGNLPAGNYTVSVTVNDIVQVYPVQIGTDWFVLNMYINKTISFKRSPGSRASATYGKAGAVVTAFPSNGETTNLEPGDYVVTLTVPGKNPETYAVTVVAANDQPNKVKKVEAIII